MITENRVKRLEKKISNLRGARDKHRTTIQKHTSQLAELQTDIAEIRASMNTKPEIPDVPFDLPKDITGLPDLIQFVLQHPMMGSEWGLTEVASKKMQSALIRDLLAETFPDIERVNDQQEHHKYSAPAEAHRDAIVLIMDPSNRKLDRIMDICVASSDPGSVLSKTGHHSLCWRHEKKYPNGWVK